MVHKVSEITVTLGITKSLGPKTFEFARIDLVNRCVLEEPLEVGSKEYKMAHKEIWAELDKVLNRAVAELVQEE